MVDNSLQLEKTSVLLYPEQSKRLPSEKFVDYIQWSIMKNKDQNKKYQKGKEKW